MCHSYTHTCNNNNTQQKQKTNFFSLHPSSVSFFFLSALMLCSDKPGNSKTDTWYRSTCGGHHHLTNEWIVKLYHHQFYNVSFLHSGYKGRKTNLSHDLWMDEEVRPSVRFYRPRIINQSVAACWMEGELSVFLFNILFSLSQRRRSLKTWWCLGELV